MSYEPYPDAEICAVGWTKTGRVRLTVWADSGDHARAMIGRRITIHAGQAGLDRDTPFRIATAERSRVTTTSDECELWDLWLERRNQIEPE